ncbi:MAG: hypothetical protein FVQ79_14215, partial [Planctomycetes bacterium]|nr:hypothetical protein [Planctomycetota bacterium]
MLLKKGLGIANQISVHTELIAMTTYKISCPSNAVLKTVAYLDEPVSLTDKVQPLWKGEIIEDGKVTKTVIYGACTSDETDSHDLVTGGRETEALQTGKSWPGKKPVEILGVLESLKKSLIEISSDWPELAGVKDIRIEGPSENKIIYRLDYRHNCKFMGKRGHKDTGPNAVHIEFRVSKQYGAEEDHIYGATKAPQYSWPNLKMDGWASVHVGKNPSTGFEAEIRTLFYEKVLQMYMLDAHKRARIFVGEKWSQEVSSFRWKLQPQSYSLKTREIPKLTVTWENTGKEKLAFSPNQYSVTLFVKKNSKPYGHYRRIDDVQTARGWYGPDEIGSFELQLDENWGEYTKASDKHKRLELPDGEYEFTVRMPITIAPETPSARTVTLKTNSVQIEISPSETPAAGVEGATDKILKPYISFKHKHRARNVLITPDGL